jgi:membrane associated rhomboid family serine protease
MGVSAFVIAVIVSSFTWFILREPDNVKNYALLPDAILHQRELWRLVTGPLVHRDLIHLTENMIGFVTFSFPIESRIGSTRFIYVIVVTTLTSSVLYFIFSVALDSAQISPGHMQIPVVGWSGVVYAMWACCTPGDIDPGRVVGAAVATAGHVGLEWFHTGEVAVLAHFAGIVAAILWRGGRFDALIPTERQGRVQECRSLHILRKCAYYTNAHGRPYYDFRNSPDISVTTPDPGE